MDSNKGDNRGDNRGDNKGGIKQLVPLSIISAVFFNPLAVLVNREGNLLLKA